MNIQMMEGFYQILMQLERDPQYNIIVLQGEGRVFSAGGDIEVMRQGNIDGSIELVERVTRQFQKIIQTIRSSKKLFVSLVQGAAMGGGAGLALSADLVYAVEKTKFGWPYVHLGLGPDGGASYELLKSFGRFKALEILLFGRSVFAEELEQRGLINEVIAEQNWEQRTNDILNDLSFLPPSLISDLKSLLTSANDLDTAAILSLEYQTMMNSADHAYHKEKVEQYFTHKHQTKNKPNH
jgi:enoyl-CoA hydratase/carnithine racemase